MIPLASFLVQGISVRHCWHWLFTENLQSPELNVLSYQILIERHMSDKETKSHQAF